MKKWFCLLSLLFPLSVFAAEYTTAKQIRLAVEEQVGHYLRNNSELHFEVGHIDSHLRLKSCQIPLNVSIPNRHGTNKMLVTVRCESNVFWKIFVPVKLIQRQKVLVMRHSLPSGAILSRSDLVLEERELTQQNHQYLKQAPELVGMELKHAVRAGDIIRKKMLKAPVYVKRGDIVQIIAQKGTFRVQMQGVAQKSGGYADEISIKNINTNRIIIAKITKRGLAELQL